ncbi:MAG: hypothetical protein A2Z99_19800 [Treponema sp. GWB1_62_6]|nr:MAG: hypothetical protein A2001_10025 [Treponema sp. GWC1_61_84]OHE71166.1 MAG: hypothetical protein A2Z99_19800 [Treponema sp. GWB1_62_6]
MTLESRRTKVLFLGIVAKAKRRYRFSIENFSIMGNHVHFIIKPHESANLSRIMQWIKGVFAMTYNRIHQITGSFWGGRFYSRVLADLSDLFHTFGYIDMNPVRANLVNLPKEWCFGGLFHRKCGRSDIVDPMPPGLDILLPDHSILLLI